MKGDKLIITEEHVSAARKMDAEKVKEIADGRIFTGQQAIEIGLVDSLGGYSDALAFLKDTLNLPDKTKVIEKKKHAGFFTDMIAQTIMKYIPNVLYSHKPYGSYFLLENF